MKSHRCKFCGECVDLEHGVKLPDGSVAHEECSVPPKLTWDAVEPCAPCTRDHNNKKRTRRIWRIENMTSNMTSRELIKTIRENKDGTEAWNAMLEECAARIEEFMGGPEPEESNQAEED